MSYADAHAIMQHCGRVPGKGCKFGRLIPQLRQVSGWLWNSVKNWDTRGPTVAAFARQHQQGRFVIRVKGHVLALVDGHILDNHRRRPRERVKSAWELQPRN